MHQHAFIYKTFVWIASRFRGFLPNNLGAWTRVRTAPKLAPKTLHERVKDRHSINKTTGGN